MFQCNKYPFLFSECKILAFELCVCIYMYTFKYICSSLHGGLKWGLLRSVGKEEAGEIEGGYFINVAR